MATPIDPTNAMDWDEPLNQTPDYTAIHVFSTNDITGTFDGLTQGDVLEGETPVIDFSAAPMVTKEGVNLYPINSEFGYVLTDFVGAVEKDFVDNPEYAEGWAGDIIGAGGEQIGLVLSDASTDTFKTPALLGTWLSGLGGNTVKASTEHYVVMQHILSDQAFPGDPNAVYPLDDNLIMIGGDYDGYAVKDLLDGVDVDGIGYVKIGDVNGDGTADIRDMLQPNETTIDSNIAASADYSVTMKDDGKLLYRWGNAIKKPNDIRIEAELPLPDEWKDTDDATPDLKPLFRVTQAELVVHHTITNNPNDQVRPEDFENESAIGTLPTYEILDDGKWVTTDGYYAGDGTFYEAGTVLRDPALAANSAGSLVDEIGTLSVDLEMGFTNAWYTTMNREPFEPVLNEAGDDYVVGPRWRLQTDKYGQDLPSVVIPIDPSATANPTKSEVKYEVGMETQTVLNLLDWENPISPLSISAGWQNAVGQVSENGLNMTDNFDIAIYIKGDIKPATIYSAELVMSYDEIEIFAADVAINGTEASDYLVGQGNNTFTGGGGEDLFVLSYGVTDNWDIVSSTITDFEDGVDTLGFIGLNVNALNFAQKVTQVVVDGSLKIAIDGFEIASLTGVTEKLDLEEDFLITTNSFANEVVGTTGADTLIGTTGDDNMSGLAGDDYLYGLSGNDTLDGGAGTDRLYGDTGADVYVLKTGSGLDIVYDFDVASDRINIEGIGSDSMSLLMYKGVDAEIRTSSGDRMVLRNIDVTDLTEENFIGTNIVNTIKGTTLADLLQGTSFDDAMSGLAGNDTIYGHDGEDVLDGGAGTDRLYGGSDADMFVFAPGTGLDVVYDFENGVDMIRVKGIAPTDVSFLAYGASDAEIRSSSGDRMVLRNVDVADLTTDDLIFDSGYSLVG